MDSNTLQEPASSVFMDRVKYTFHSSWGKEKGPGTKVNQ